MGEGPRRDPRRRLTVDQAADQDAAQPSVVARLENEVRFLREELARKDAILLNMTEAMKALSPPQEEPPEAPREATEQPGRVVPQPAVEGAQEAAGPRSWWRRVFGG